MSDMEFTATRLSSGNTLFPDKIILTDDGIFVRRPFLYSHKEIFIPYKEVSAITINTQVVGFATIFIYARGSSISSHNAVIEVHGFLRRDAEQIRNLIISKGNGSVLPARDARGVPPVALKWVPPVAGK